MNLFEVAKLKKAAGMSLIADAANPVFLWHQDEFAVLVVLDNVTL